MQLSFQHFPHFFKVPEVGFEFRLAKHTKDQDKDKDNKEKMP